MMQSGIFSPNRRTLYAMVLVVLCLAIMAAVGGAIYSSLALHSSDAAIDDRNATAEIIRPPESFKFKTGIDPLEAESINAGVPDSREPIIAAGPLTIMSSATKRNDQLSAVDCLTAAIYYEAASENGIGQRAVAQVVLNRVRHPAYPNSVCGVVFQGSSRITGCQFSFTCDGSLARRPSTAGWARARQVAAMALSGFVEPSVGLATHYHTIWVVPYWSSNLTKLRTIGAHIFYRWNGSQGTRKAFSSRYANTEVMPDALTAKLQGFLLTDPATEMVPDITSENELPAAQTKQSKIEPDSFVKSAKGTLLDSSGSLTSASSQKHDLFVDAKAAALRNDHTSLLVDQK